MIKQTGSLSPTFRVTCGSFPFILTNADRGDDDEDDVRVEWWTWHQPCDNQTASKYRIHSHLTLALLLMCFQITNWASNHLFIYFSSIEFPNYFLSCEQKWKIELSMYIQTFVFLLAHLLCMPEESRLRQTLHSCTLCPWCFHWTVDIRQTSRRALLPAALMTHVCGEARKPQEWKKERKKKHNATCPTQKLFSCLCLDDANETRCTCGGCHLKTDSEHRLEVSTINKSLRELLWFGSLVGSLLSETRYDSEQIYVLCLLFSFLLENLSTCEKWMSARCCFREKVERIGPKFVSYKSTEVPWDLWEELNCIYICESMRLSGTTKHILQIKH